MCARACVQGQASLDAALHHPVLAVPPAGAGLVALEDQGGLDLVKLLEQPPVLGRVGRTTFLCGSTSLPRSPETPQENPPLASTQSVDREARLGDIIYALRSEDWTLNRPLDLHVSDQAHLSWQHPRNSRSALPSLSAAQGRR